MSNRIVRKSGRLEDESRKTVMLDYLTFLRKARDLLNKEAPHLWLAADTPFWWDKDALVMEFEGKTKRFSEHVQDLTDFVVIMSYRCSVKKVLDCVENERRYAKEINKLIFPSLETVKLKQDPYISFWGLTIHDLLSVVSQLLEVAKADPTMGGVMIHCYRSLIEKFNDEVPGAAGKMPPDVPTACNAPAGAADGSFRLHEGVFVPHVRDEKGRTPMVKESVGLSEHR